MRLSSVFTLAALFASAANPVQAADRAGARVDVDRGGVHVDVGVRDRADARAVRVKDMIGADVYNPSNENLGEIEDLVMDPSSGKIRYAVLSFGGFLGLGDKLFAVPWGDLKLVTKGTTSEGTAKEDHYVLNVSKEALKNAPGFDKSRWPDFADRNWSADIDRFYTGQRSATSGSTRR